MFLRESFRLVCLATGLPSCGDVSLLTHALGVCGLFLQKSLSLFYMKILRRCRENLR